MTIKTGINYYNMGKRKTYPRNPSYADRGRTKDQGVPDELAAVRHKTFIHLLPKCAKEGCKNPRMTHTRFCRKHGGGKIAARHRPYVKREKKAWRNDQGREELPPLTQEMRAHPLYRIVFDDYRLVHEFRRIWGTPEFPEWARRTVRELSQSANGKA